MRDDFSPKTIEILAKRVGYRCSNLSCRKLTSGPHEEAHKSVNIGVAAHITAAAPGGKRYDASLSSEERRSIENGMWLCQNCGKLIDNDEQKYSVDLLRSWKREAEQQAQSEVERSTSGSASSEPTRFKSYLESVVDYYQYWWKDYAFMDAINEQTWFEFSLSSTTKAKSQNSERQPKDPPPDPPPDSPPQLVLDAIRDYASEKILIVGAPGAGKSTLLAQVLRIAAVRAKEDPNAPIPVLIALRDVKTAGDGASISGLVMRSLKSHDYSLNDDALTSLFTGNGRRLLLLVDGLNEKPDAKSDLKQFCRNISLIATGRHDGDGWEIERKLELQPLSREQVTKFCQERLPNADHAQLKILGDRVQDFGQTPLMVWMLYSIFQTTGSTPATRGEAYRAFTTLYTERAKEGVDLTDSRVLLGKLAFEMMRSPNPDDPTDFQLKVPEIEAQSILGSEATLKRMSNHLIRQQGTPGNREISFCHQSLQEYYAAEALLERLPSLGNAELQREYLNYLKWTEPVALMLALVQSEAQALRVVRLALDVDWMLGARLAGKVQQEFQAQTIKLIDALSLQECLRIKLISKMNTSLAVSALESQLKEDSNPDTRRLAAIALRVMGRSSSEAELIQALKDKDLNVKSAAASALSRLGTENALPSLSTMLDDEDPYVSMNVVNAIKNITARCKNKRKIRLTSTSKYLQAKYKTIGWIQERFDKNIDSSKDRTLEYCLEDNEQEEQAVNVDKLINELNTPDLMECGRIARKIGEMKLGLAVPALIDLLPRAMNKSYTFEKVTKALGYIGDIRAVSPLLQLLSCRILPKHLLKDVFNALAEIDVSTLLEPMRSIFKSQDREISAALIYVLPGRKVNAPILSQLTYVLQDSDSGIRGQVAAVFEEEGIPDNLNALWKAYQQFGEFWFYEAIRSIQGRCKYYHYEIFCSPPAPPPPSQQDTLAQIGTTVNAIDQRTKQMSETPNISIGTISGGIQNFTPNQGTQIGHQNNNYFGADDTLLQQITELQQFITELETQHPHIQTLPEAEAARDQAITKIQATNPTRWQTIRHQMRLLKRQLLNPERHAQAAKATLIEVTKAAWEKSLIAKAIITYIDKLSETPDQGA
jgi:HEAT repeat protein